MNIDEVIPSFYIIRPYTYIIDIHKLYIYFYSNQNSFVIGESLNNYIGIEILKKLMPELYFIL